ncbi:drug/metabolite transporter (DMT)-like permease [Paenibacillus shirakamiensis]|uniref:Drug/metabolite transporter (DMT)-like permease n=1 Tax=Paenibacillus shirakamiensis TaxID=1265935 RepID=A0ABS4JHP4_9BACL|nr:DMT family transporter [Paenibacillus shirakamiensis]MBP2001227.1 drug/metabolite transporter (DMT)-like permease [Paenibacillus shirakamiensis]
MENVNTATLHFNTKKRINPGFWFVVMGAALWGADPLFRILLLKYFTSTQIVLLEHILLFVFAAPVLWRHRAELKSIRLRHAVALIFISWGGSAIASILFTQALSPAHGDLNAVLLLQKMQPIFAIVLARIILKEHLPKYFSWLIVVALTGTYLLTFGFSLPFGHFNNFIKVGSLLSLGAAALWGGSTVMGRYMLGSMKYETVTSLRFILALPLLFIINASQGAAWTVPTGGAEITSISINLFLQALLPGMLSLLLYYKGLSTTKASFATLAELSFPMVGVLINWIAFHQMITWAQFTGFIFIWVTLFIISRQQQPEPAESLQ